MYSLDHVIKTLKDFKNLEPNWDSYDSEPIDHECIKNAIILVKELHKYGMELPYVCPLYNGMIQLEWHYIRTGISTDVEIEFLTPDSTDLVIMSKNFHDIVDSEKIKKLIDIFR